MNIVVLVKQVPAISDIEIDAKTNNLVRVGAPTTINPVDLHAIEMAMLMKEEQGGTVTMMTMGTAAAADVLREGIAVGADRGILISDERLGGSDTLATGRVLARAIEKTGDVDLVLTGKQSNDGETGQIAPAIAQRWGSALITYAESLRISDGKVIGTRKNNDGIETIEAALPAVCSIMETSNTPRQPKLKGKMAAKKAVFDVWRIEDLGLAGSEVGAAGSATTVTEVFAPTMRDTGFMVKGDDEMQSVKKLVEILAAEKVI